MTGEHNTTGSNQMENKWTRNISWRWPLVRPKRVEKKNYACKLRNLVLFTYCPCWAVATGKKQNHSTNAPYSSLSTRCLERTNRQTWEPSKKIFSFGNREEMIKRSLTWSVKVNYTTLIPADYQRERSTQHLFMQFLKWHLILLHLLRYTTSVRNFQPCDNFSRWNKLIVFFTNTAINLLTFRRYETLKFLQLLTRQAMYV
jgi:hypothetical protein